MFELDGLDMAGRIRAFDKAHGDSVRDGKWIVYEDGATREKDPTGALCPPPAHPHERALQKLIYRRIVLRDAIAEFDAYRTLLLNRVQINLQSEDCGPRPDGNCMSELRRLHKIAAVAKAAYEKVDAEAEATKPPRLRKREHCNIISRTENQTALREIESMQI